MYTLEDDVKKPFLTIIGRIFSGKKIAGYYVRDMYGVEKPLYKDETIRLAQKGAIYQVKTQKSKDGLILRGVDFELTKIPSFRCKSSK